MALEKLLKTRSLRFWIALSMSMALVPLGVSAVGGYFLLNHGVVASFNDVAFRQRHQIIPTQHLRLLMWDTLVPVDEFVEEGNPVHLGVYRELRAEIEKEFALLDKNMESQPTVRTLVQRARDDWTSADHRATELISVPMPRGDARTARGMQLFHGEIAAATDKLAAVYSRLNGDVKDDHDRALLSYERSIWIAGIAAGLSLMTIIGAVIMIGRIITSSVDRLVDGAARFAQGDRDHLIEVQVPPELRRVAEEFNHMIGRIHDSEEVLSELARRDGLTGLSNRRAFDDALPELLAQVQRFGEHGALLSIDIDHFKRINDTYGHAAGDEVLRVLAKTMESNVRPFDRLFRVGGEEFAALLPKTNRAAAVEAAERLRAKIAAAPFKFKGTEIHVTVSIGIACTSETAEQDALVGVADSALYQAKSEGRNRIVVGGKQKGQDAA